MSDSTPSKNPSGFSELGLGEMTLKALDGLGFDTPTPIQELAIPLMLEGRDIIGQAQTGTGKTAAFALPLLEKMDVKVKSPQMLVMAPTRELALQVCDAMKDYGKFMKGLKVLPVYGGQGMSQQLQALKRGVHVVVGTPGRLIDHLERGTLNLDQITALVLDEADEMLRMGFVEEVEKILESVPEERQTALFSATMPPRIRQIAKRFLNDPAEVKTKSKETTVESISQYVIPVSGEKKKIEAFTRLLMTEQYDGMIVFVRTKAGTVDLVDTMESRGFSAMALNGDMTQQARQRTVMRFKRGDSDILICTDVAARGLDVPRITHVLNFDIPRDTEGYVHRIGRTGRAGRDGKAILFAGNREKRMLHNIERATGKKIERMSLPTSADMSARRVDEFKAHLTKTLEGVELERFREVVNTYCAETEADPIEVAAALTYLAQESRPFDVPEIELEDRDRGRDRKGKERGREPRSRGRDRFDDGGSSRRRERDTRSRRGRDDEDSRGGRKDKRRDKRGADESPRRGRKKEFSEHKMELFQVAVGREHGLNPSHLVGAIINEAGLDRSHIGDIRVSSDHTTVELPEGMPPEVLSHLKKVWTCGTQLNMERVDGKTGGRGAKRTRPRKSAAAARVMGKIASKKKGGKKSRSKTPRKK